MFIWQVSVSMLKAYDSQPNTYSFPTAFNPIPNGEGLSNCMKINSLLITTGMNWLKGSLYAFNQQDKYWKIVAKSQITITPNLAHSEITISYKVSNQGQATLEILDMLGRIHKAIPLPNNKQSEIV